MNFKELIAQFRSLLANAAGAEVSFGQPVKVGDLHIIPVAKVAFGFGGGGGNSGKKTKKDAKDVVEPSPEPTDPPDTESNYGGGGGGGVKTDPIGIYTIKGEVVKFHPVIGVKEMLGALALISVVFIRLTRSKKKGK